MHEFSLAQGLHWQLLDLARDHHARKITRAEILIGGNAGIVEESFLFGVNVLIAQDPRTEGMEVVILRDDGQDLMLMKVELDSGDTPSG
ncbi:MAG: hydrogenase maturation nickel metallochaperone HypA [Desulfobulbaceae bacterium]|nr:MAG: hydrogenase maturation nickel metallochaperone HypA [Desulfobulbaceae bacterium]